MSRSNERNLVYGEVAEDLVVMFESEANRNVQIRDAIERSQTFGEIRNNLPGDVWEQLIEDHMADFGLTEEPAADEAFDYRTLLIGYAAGEGGHGIVWGKQTMLDWVPDEVYELGVERTTALDGPYLELRPQQEHDVVAALTRIGYTCRRDDRLVQDAEGWP